MKKSYNKVKICKFYEHLCSLFYPVGSPTQFSTSTLFLGYFSVFFALLQNERDNFFFYLGFLSRPLTNHRTAGEGGGHFINSSLPLPPASQTLRHQPDNYRRELASAHSLQPDSNQEPLDSECRSLTSKICASLFCKRCFPKNEPIILSLTYLYFHRTVLSKKYLEEFDGKPIFQACRQNES